MQSSIGASGDFAYAYVIAHEVGHHVQYLLGTLTEAHDAMSRMSETLQVAKIALNHQPMSVIALCIRITSLRRSEICVLAE